MDDERSNHINEQQSSLKSLSGANNRRVKFIVYGEPVAKGRPRVVGNHAYTPEKTKEQEEKVAWSYRAAHHGFKFDDGVPLRMEVDMYVKIPKGTSKKKAGLMQSGEIRPAKRVLDVDNGAKLVMDSINGIAYHDDAQIVEIEARKFYSENPRTEVLIEEL